MDTGIVYGNLLQTVDTRGGGFMMLIDPDKGYQKDYLATCESAQECGVDAILVGSSFMLNSNFAGAVRDIKQATTLPVVQATIPSTVTKATTTSTVTPDSTSI